ncbi:MAG: thioredoxin family protein [Muribaculaceae bacterium]|nr:thioredoxin family protein [Muribaculaceae bacterium]
MDYNDLINSNEVVMVEFFATWCPHCQKMMPVVEQLRQLVNGNVDIHQLDIDRNGEAANAAGVESVPTFIIYKDGREQWRQSGEIDGEVLLSRIEAY